MKKFTLFFSCLIAGSMWAQNPCATGRYATDVFANYTTTSDIVYGQNTSWNGASTTLKLDVYQPTGDTETNRPLIIWVHGGSFIGGTKTDGDMVAFSQKFAKKGYVCASIDYRLGFFPFDSANAVKAVVRAVQDLRAAVRFFYKDKQTTDTYKIDTNNIYVGGSSAGAITSLHLAYLDDECEVSDYLNQTTITQLGNLEGTSGNPGYSSNVKGVLNGCGALARYSWLEAGDVPVASVHGTNDGTVKYNRGIVNPGTPLMYLDGSRMIHERACAVGVDNQFYTFLGAPHVPYAGNAAYMDTTVNFFRDFLIKQLGCTDAAIQPENNRAQAVNLYPINYCDGTPVNEVCPTSSLVEENLLYALIYPNPAQHTIQVVPSLEGKYTVSILDISGRILLFKEMETGIAEISINTLSNGNYFIKVQSGKSTYTEQIIKY
ncbi:MAG: T9SS type A sorting domain-containing protein [Crocinitomicaceae bacterium]